MKNLPQEIEIWYLIPSLRKELAKIFIADYKLKQKEVSKLLGITEASVSHYANSHRGGKIKFSNEEKKEIKNSAKKIIEGKSSLVKELYYLCSFFRKSKVLCKVHKDFDKNIPKNCSVCFDN
jgi:hypothetical protein